MADETKADQQKSWVDPKDAREAGYWGYVPDETPNEDYTVAGVTRDAPKSKPTVEKKSAARGGNGGTQ